MFVDVPILYGTLYYGTIAVRTYTVYIWYYGGNIPRVLTSIDSRMYGGKVGIDSSFENDLSNPHPCIYKIMKYMKLIEFYTKYCLINGNPPKLTQHQKWLLDGLENGSIKRVWKRGYGFQYKKT